MILQALTAYYEEMLHKGKISAPGWDETFRVSFQLEIDDTGALVDVIDCREPATSGKKQVLLPRQMRVPAHVKRASGIVSNFLWGDRIFEKCGIRRDEGGDGGKTLEIRGKRRLSARDGGANYQQS